MNIRKGGVHIEFFRKFVAGEIVEFNRWPWELLTEATKIDNGLIFEGPLVPRRKRATSASQPVVEYLLSTRRNRYRTLMAQKLFSPLKVGALELQHRLVREFVRARPTSAKPRRRGLEPSNGQWDEGGLIILDPASSLVSVTRFLTRRSAEQAGPTSIAERAHAADQKIVLRLSEAMARQHTPKGSLPDLDAERSIPAYCSAAESALRLGFDGIELDGAHGTLIDSLLNPENGMRPDCYGTALSERLSYIDELVESLKAVCGGDRVGVRLAPFRMRCAPEGALMTFTAALRAIGDREVAYVNLTGSPAMEPGGIAPAAMPVGADLFRRAYPGPLIASGEYTLASAIELTNSRWADAVCFQSWPPRQRSVTREIE